MKKPAYLLFAFAIGGLFAIGLIVSRIAMLDLDVAVIHQNGVCIAINQHDGKSHEFGKPDANGRCWLGWRLFF